MLTLLLCQKSAWKMPALSHHIWVEHIFPYIPCDLAKKRWFFSCFAAKKPRLLVRQSPLSWPKRSCGLWMVDIPMVSWKSQWFPEYPFNMKRLLHTALGNFDWCPRSDAAKTSHMTSILQHQPRLVMVSTNDFSVGMMGVTFLQNWMVPSCSFQEPLERRRPAEGPRSLLALWEASDSETLQECGPPSNSVAGELTKKLGHQPTAAMLEWTFDFWVNLNHL